MSGSIEDETQHTSQSQSEHEKRQAVEFITEGHVRGLDKRFIQIFRANFIAQPTSYTEYVGEA